MAAVNGLELGCDCLGHIQYLDAVVNNAKGEPVVIRKAVCVHEEDAGSHHWDCRTNHSEVRRSRRLVVSMVSTFMNYEYCLYWYFYTDGSIHFELKLTGILSTRYVCGFSLKPDGFFAANPALDLPPEKDPASREEGAVGQPPQPGAAACCVAQSKL
ncbi:hypothetical protein GPECTOR_141g691 [Gonium pectorale]|uniref:Amine oxidase n=1 Tax=Gonium pectorale TaxID=33097 RepID=A0A150FXZ6_GONPE|nr:hypothetical protein GPECTOR_141g691 [Gonium pectorale]|eukprot:KXZ42493.1 hypothetical protein GPECTOR_141g691 [Gonium pectorale]